MIDKRIRDILFDSVIEIGGMLIINNRVLYSRNQFYEIKYQICTDYYCTPNFISSTVYFIGYDEFRVDFKTPLVYYR